MTFQGISAMARAVEKQRDEEDRRLKEIAGRVGQAIIRIAEMDEPYRDYRPTHLVFCREDMAEIRRILMGEDS